MYRLSMEQARELVVESGLRLVREGLVARTWGNISVRADEDSFFITPSGIAYERMRPEHIVRVFMTDLRHEGAVKPSSEKALHRAIYELKPTARAIIHTHQTAASSLSCAGKTLFTVSEEEKTTLGPSVRTAAYALPGTKKLARSAAAVIGDGNAVLLASHGAVCVGRDMDEAFRVSQVLEDLCERVVADAAARLSGKSQTTRESIYSLFIDQHTRRPADGC